MFKVPGFLVSFFFKISQIQGLSVGLNCQIPGFTATLFKIPGVSVIFVQNSRLKKSLTPGLFLLSLLNSLFFGNPDYYQKKFLNKNIVISIVNAHMKVKFVYILLKIIFFITEISNRFFKTFIWKFLQLWFFLWCKNYLFEVWVEI